jgi:hypothetical protein
MSLTWGYDNRDRRHGRRFLRGLAWALAWEAGAWGAVWFVLRHSSLWAK